MYQLIPGALNDLWKFDGTYWTWVSGSNVTGATAVFGTKGIPSPGNVPGPRYRPFPFIDAIDNLWMFGGDYSVFGSYFLRSIITLKGIGATYGDSTEPIGLGCLVPIEQASLEYMEQEVLVHLPMPQELEKTEFLGLFAPIRAYGYLEVLDMEIQLL